MKKQIIITFLLSLGVIGTQAQISEKRELSNFTKIDISGTGNVFFQQSDTVSVVVEAAEDDLKKVETKVSDNTLYIRAIGNISTNYKVRLAGRNIESIASSGASTFKTQNVLISDSLSVETSGASNISIDVEARTIISNASGASDITLNGSCTNLYADLSGATNLKAYKLQSKNATIKTSGAASAKIFVESKIVANATGASKIKFKGEPEIVSAEGSGSSQIVKIANDDSQKKIASKDSSSTSFKWGDKKVIIMDSQNKLDSIHRAKERNKDFRHWNGFFLGVNGFTDPNQNFYINKPYNYMELDYTRSFNFQLNLLQKNIHIHKNYVNLVTGLGFDFNRYQFANKVKLNADSSFTWGNVDSTNQFNYKKNRLTSYYITAPLLLEFNTNTNPKKAFHIAVGVIGKYLLGARTKQVVEQNGDTYKNIRNDGYNLNPFQFNGYVSVGYSNVTLFAQYGLNEMFKHNKGPELYPFSVGVRLLNFN